MSFVVNSCFRRFSILVSLFIFLNLPNISFAQRNLGIPVRDAMMWGAYVGPGKTGAQDTIYLSFGQYEAPLFLLAIRPDTGEIRQFNGPLSSEMGSWGWTLDHENRIYLGSYYHAHLLRFDPKTETWEDLGQPTGEKDSFICSLTTAPDGKIWGGTFPSTHLFSYDPKTGVTRNFGRLDTNQYYAYPTAGDDGLIYCAIQFEKADIVVFDPVHETKTSLIPLAERKPGRVRLTKGRDGKVYARLSSSGQWFRIEEGKKLIEVLEADIPFPLRGLPDGRQFQIIDQKLLRIENPLTKEMKEIPFRYEASGAYIFVVGTGPDGRIYGSSMLPLRLFAYDPKKEATLLLGRASHSSGEIYSMGSYDGKLYLCSYPEARLSIYDPTKLLRFGDDEEANPRDLGPLGGEQDRPRAMVAGPHGRIYIGSTPDYGLLGGAISVFDPKTKEKRVYRHIIPNQSVASLAYIEKSDLFAAGSSIRGGGGTRPSEKWAKLILWSPQEEKKILEMIPVLEAKAILALAATKEGNLYGITDNEKLFIFDVEKRITRKVIDLEFKEPRPASLQLGPDEKLYGLAKEAIFTIDPKNDRISLLIKPSVPIESGMAMLGRKIYFGSGANLWEFEIPFENPVKLPGK